MILSRRDSNNEAMSCIICAATCVCCCWKLFCSGKRCSTALVRHINKFGSFLVRILYGGDLYAVRAAEDEEMSDNEGRTTLHVQLENSLDSKNQCLYCTLVTNTVLIFTFLFMIFADLLVVRSDYGCSSDCDCYIADLNFDEQPLDYMNCTEYAATTGGRTICYSFSIMYLGAIGDTGGVLVICSFCIFLITKLTTCSLRNICNRSNQCAGTCCCCPNT